MKRHKISYYFYAILASLNFFCTLYGITKNSWLWILNAIVFALCTIWMIDER
mgnify:CR=1 FL=1